MSSYAMQVSANTTIKAAAVRHCVSSLWANNTLAPEYFTNETGAGKRVYLQATKQPVVLLSPQTGSCLLAAAAAREQKEQQYFGTSLY
jgi:hypothetical protein